MRLDQGTNIVEVRAIVDETFWQTPDIFTYVRLARIHDNLAFIRDAVPQLQRMVQSLLSHAGKLNKVELRLAHKDLHFVNVLYSPALGAINAVLDWEFSGVVPFTKWNPHRAFIWNAHHDADLANENQSCPDLFKSRCAEKGVKISQDAAYASPLQESTQTVADFLLAITEATPRD